MILYKFGCVYINNLILRIDLRDKVESCYGLSFTFINVFSEESCYNIKNGLIKVISTKNMRYFSEKCGV